MLTKLKRHFENSFFGNGCTAFDLLIWDCLLKCVFSLKNRSEDKQKEGVQFVCVCVWSEYLPWKVDRCATKLWESLSSHVTEMCAAFVLWCQQCFHLPRVWVCVCRRPSAGRRARCLDVRCLQCCHKSVSVCVGICQLPAVLLSPVTCVDLINMVSRPGHDVVSDANTPKLDRWSWSVVKV